MKEPDDKANRAVTDWKPFEQDLVLVENEILGENGPECTCPGWWFPQDIRDVARYLPHMYQGVLAHHDECAKTVHYWNKLKLRHGGGGKTRFA